MLKMDQEKKTAEQLETGETSKRSQKNIDYWKKKREKQQQKMKKKQEGATK